MKMTMIVVNGRPKYILQRMLTRDDVLLLAGYDWRTTDVLVDEMAVKYRIQPTYERYPLRAQDAMQVVEGMIIDVYCPPDEHTEYNRS